MHPTALYRFALTLCMIIAAALPTAAQQSCPMVEMRVERLPDLHVPRLGHSVVVVNGEVTVFGGHTTGFIPTQTAEYFSDGEWHTMQMVYPHDHATTAVTPTGGCCLPEDTRRSSASDRPLH